MALTRMIRTTLWVLLGVVLALILLSVFWAPPHLISTTPYPVDQTPATRSLDYQDITILSDDLLLEGWWIPASQPIADLIFVHGAGSNRISQYIGSLFLSNALRLEHIGCDDGHPQSWQFTSDRRHIAHGTGGVARCGRYSTMAGSTSSQ